MAKLLDMIRASIRQYVQKSVEIRSTIIYVIFGRPGQAIYEVSSSEELGFMCQHVSALSNPLGHIIQATTSSFLSLAHWCYARLVAIIGIPRFRSINCGFRKAHLPSLVQQRFPAKLMVLPPYRTLRLTERHGVRDLGVEKKSWPKGTRAL
jgi:hypothetical protein